MMKLVSFCALAVAVSAQVPATHVPHSEPAPENNRWAIGRSIIDLTLQIIETFSVGGAQQPPTHHQPTNSTTTHIDDSAYESSLIDALLDIANIEFLTYSPDQQPTYLQRLRQILTNRQDNSLVDHILNGGKVIDLVDPEARARREEMEFDWTGYTEYSEFCPQGVCPRDVQCLVAKYTSTSGQKCKCPDHTELAVDIYQRRYCTDWSDMMGEFRYYEDLCPKGKCDKDAYCVDSVLNAPSMCACLPGFELNYSSLLKKWRCRRA